MQANTILFVLKPNTADATKIQALPLIGPHHYHSLLSISAFKHKYEIQMQANTKFKYELIGYFEVFHIIALQLQLAWNEPISHRCPLDVAAEEVFYG